MVEPVTVEHGTGSEPFPERGFYPAVEPSAAVYPLLQELWPRVRQEMARHVGVDAVVHTELRTAVAPSGELERRRFYWSTQHADPASALGFRARTLHCDAGPAVARVHTFPSEPTLTWLDAEDGPLRDDGRWERVDILRYIPLRRLTFRLHDGARLPPRVIAKVKRPNGLTRAAIAFLAVDAAARRRRSDAPAVPRLQRMEPPRHALYLEELPGEPLDRAVGSLELTGAMEELGRLHRGLQELDVRSIAVRRTVKDWLMDARDAAGQVRLFVPSAAAQARAAYLDLERTAPADGRLLFCQGDFLPGQILCHERGWSVVDFDDSRYADPLSEVAAMYVAMPRELGLSPELAETARRTYLEAYARRAGEPFDQQRWEWFVKAVRLIELGKRLMKGRAAPGEAQSVLEAVTGNVEQR